MHKYKRFYITQKQVLEYILRGMLEFENKEVFKQKLQLIIDDLNEFPKDNRNQLKFFTRVSDTLDNVEIT
jgi:hypothetical protein